MPIRVGLLTEGHDHRIFAAFLAKLLSVAEAELETDVIDGPGRGWQFVERNVDKALRRFYGRCTQLAIIAMDNDGNLDLRATGGQEDPRHPRHWLHHAGTPRQDCRWCRLKGLADQTRLYLNWIEGKPGNNGQSSSPSPSSRSKPGS